MLRQALVNLLTSLATVAVLGAIAVGGIAAATRAHGSEDAQSGAAGARARGGETQTEAPAPHLVVPKTSLDAHKVLVGVAADPWHIDEWDAAVGARFDIAMNFYAWSKQRNPRDALAEAARRGVIPMITWEPWRPVPASEGTDAQGGVQLRYSNTAIAAGRHDPYLRMFARAVASHPGPVILRYGHEMNGYWYPWHADPASFVLAWRHVVRLFRAEGASNAVFVWSVNPSLYIASDDEWMAQIRPYWPGARFVDWVGSTMINFGGIKNHGVHEYAQRIRKLRVYRKPVMLSEVNVHFANRKPFLRDLRSLLAEAGWLKAMVWSQFPSRGQATLQDSIPIGRMNWQATNDTAASRLLGAIVRDAHRSPSRRAGASPGY